MAGSTVRSLILSGNSVFKLGINCVYFLICIRSRSSSGLQGTLESKCGNLLKDDFKGS